MATLDAVRPNIRVEIHNNLVSEAMDVDDKDEEEGEIRDNDSDIPEENIPPANSEAPINASIFPQTRATFLTGFDVFDKSEQEKMQERAKRFALKPNEINRFTSYDIQQLYESLNVNANNNHNVRFTALHMRTTPNITSVDVFQYFEKFAPTSVEWICNESCNIVWADKFSAARALHYCSQVIRDMPVRGQNELLEKDVDEDQEMVLVNANREVELQQEDVLEEPPNSTLCLRNSVDISAVTIPIPPGYWRRGTKDIKTKSVLLRFALKTDKKPYETESLFSSRKPRSNGNEDARGIFTRNKDLAVDLEKNPWGVLAENWDEDARFREREPNYLREGTVEPEPEIETSTAPVVTNASLKVRLGATKKRKETDSEGIKTSKVPRMRMYADEEEEKIRRKRLLQTIKKQTEKIDKKAISNSDLRSILGITNHKVKKKTEKSSDLGLNLKNRSRKFLFTVAQQPERRYYSSNEEERISPISFKDEDKLYRERSRERHIERRRRRSIERRHHRSPERRMRRRSPHRKYGRMYSSRVEEEDFDSTRKPKSKVAVVIKTQKLPTVASAIRSRLRKSSSESSSDSSSEEESESSEASSSSSEASSSSEETAPPTPPPPRRLKRPGFKSPKRNFTLSTAEILATPLKVEIDNEHYKK